MNLAQKLGLPYREGFIKNRYVGRTFIMPGQQMRFVDRASLYPGMISLNPLAGVRMFGGSSTLWRWNSLIRTS